MAPAQQNGGPEGGQPGGRRPRVPAGARIYAVGDIHGRADLLRRINREIERDAASAPARKVVVYIGDYIDRGPDSAGVVELLLDRPLPGFETVHLKGNHEDFLVRFWADGSDAELWMMNGGVATLQSYGIDLFDLASGPRGLETAWSRFRAALPPRHLEFFQDLRMRHLEGDYLFVHAGVRPGVALDRQNDFDLLWIREEFLDSEADLGPVVVHGHSIRGEPEVRPNRIGIDTGAFHTGHLTCLVLEGESRRFLAT